MYNEFDIFVSMTSNIFISMTSNNAFRTVMKKVSNLNIPLCLCQKSLVLFLDASLILGNHHFCSYLFYCCWWTNACLSCPERKDKKESGVLLNSGCSSPYCQNIPEKRPCWLMLLESSGLKRLFSNTAGLITRNCWHWIPGEGSRPTADDPSKWNPHSCTSSSHTLSICQWFPILILQQSLLSLEYLCKKPPNMKKKTVQMASYTFCFGIFCDSEQHHTWIQGMMDIS